MKRQGIRPVLIAIVGGSGSGKTWLADQLQAELGIPATRLCQDDFYRDLSHLAPRTRTRVNFDHPRAIEWSLLEKAIRGCWAGRPVRVPGYDFESHCRTRRTRLVKPQSLMIVDGLWLLRKPELRSLFDMTVFLDCRASTRLSRRIIRDTVSRGRTAASVREQFRRTVQPMHMRYVSPQKRWAGVVLTERCGAAEIRELAARVRHKLNATDKDED